MRDHIGHDWILDHNDIDGTYIYESPDGGKTHTRRPSSAHPITILTNGELPIDTWYKIYGGSKNER